MLVPWRVPLSSLSDMPFEGPRISKSLRGLSRKGSCAREKNLQKGSAGPNGAKPKFLDEHCGNRNHAWKLSKSLAAVCFRKQRFPPSASK